MWMCFSDGGFPVRLERSAVTFTERRYSCPVGGSAAHVVEAGSSQLIGGVWSQTCRVYMCLFIQNI